MKHNEPVLQFFPRKAYICPVSFEQVKAIPGHLLLDLTSILSFHFCLSLISFMDHDSFSPLCVLHSLPERRDQESGQIGWRDGIIPASCSFSLILKSQQSIREWILAKCMWVKKKKKKMDFCMMVLSSGCEVTQSRIWILVLDTKCPWDSGKLRVSLAWGSSKMSGCVGNAHEEHWTLCLAYWKDSVNVNCCYCCYKKVTPRRLWSMFTSSNYELRDQPKYTLSLHHLCSPRLEVQHGTWLVGRLKHSWLCYHMHQAAVWVLVLYGEEMTSLSGFLLV